MAIKVIYLQTAVEDLASIYKYIARDSVKYAKLEVQKIKAFTDSLKKPTTVWKAIPNYARERSAIDSI
jgi:plasmid stabilization system protein ParE